MSALQGLRLFAAVRGFVNPHFAEREETVLQDMVESVRFGVLVLCADGLLAAHVPFVPHREEGPARNAARACRGGRSAGALSGRRAGGTGDLLRAARVRVSKLVPARGAADVQLPRGARLRTATGDR
jgi:hypothetical protein